MVDFQIVFDFVSATEIRDRVVAVVGAGARRFSAQTVRRRLHAGGLYARRLVKKAALLLRHRDARLQWAQQHVRWTRQQWQTVMFTDEMRACLRHTDGRKRVWRRRGEQHAECCVQPVTAFGGGSVMVWEGISTRGKTELTCVEVFITI